MSLTAVWVPLWWKAMGRCWLRKSVCCSLVPCRDHLRQKVLELQLSIASPTVSACQLRPSTTTVQLYWPWTHSGLFASAFGKGKSNFVCSFSAAPLSSQGLSQICFNLYPAPSHSQYGLQMSLQSDCSRIQNFDLFFFYNVVGMMSSNRPSKENVEQHEELEFSISHRVLLYLRSPLSQEDKISSENLSLVIFD